MQAPLNFPCANCGAHLVVDGSTQTPSCAYCHTQTLLPEEVWLRFHPAPPPALASPVALASSRGSKSALWITLASVGALALVFAVIAIVVAANTTSAPSRSYFAMPGEACRGRAGACSIDKKASLRCGVDDKLAVAMTCKGPNGCRLSSDGDSRICDYTLADVNDPCVVTDEACSTDHKAELRCQGGQFTVVATCKGPDGCTLTPAKNGAYTLSCDDHIADVGDPCFDAERTACSADHKSFLSCTAQRFVVDHACKGRGGCTVKKNAGTSTVTMDCDMGR